MRSETLKLVTALVWAWVLALCLGLAIIRITLAS